jgi:hypothetical protein
MTEHAKEVASLSRKALLGAAILKEAPDGTLRSALAGHGFDLVMLPTPICKL